MIKRIDKIKEYVKTKTEELIEKDILSKCGGIDALNCALDLKLDRANVSKDLNLLWKNGDLIKIQGKPVYYLHYQTLIFNYPDNFFPSFISANDSIENYIGPVRKKEEASIEKDEKNQNDPFDSIIGSKGSLSDVILNAKSAVAYPPHGIASIIYGNVGVGKTALATCMYEFAKQIHSENLPFKTIYCQNFLNDSSAFNDTLLGTTNKSENKQSIGLLDLCSNGVLLIEQIEALSEANQNVLSTIIQKKQYQSTNSTKQKSLKTMIILTTTLKDNDKNISNLSRTVPIHLKLTDIDSRGIYEKLELIMDLLQKESRTTGFSIRIHKDIISLFALHKYPNNIDDLHNEIQLACSRAFLKNPNVTSKTIYLDYDCLSLNILSQTQNQSINNATVISLLSCIPNSFLQFDSSGSSNAISLFSSSQDLFKEHRMSQFIGEFSVDINELDNIDNYVRENINVLKDCPKAQLNSLKAVINPYVMQVFQKNIKEHIEYGALQTNQQLLYGILIHISNYIKRAEYEVVEEENNEISVVEKIYEKEYELAKEIYSSLGAAYSFKPSSRETDFLASYLAIANQWANHTTVAILVVCHGDSIASQMVDYIKNNLKGKYTLDAINYSSSMQFNDLLELVKLKAIKINNGAGVLVACDMEPLTSLNSHIYNETGIPSLCISNITLPFLIDLVEKSTSPINDLDSLVAKNVINKQETKEQEISIIEQIRTRILSNIVSFIDTKKAVDVLMISLKNILKDLNLEYSDGIAIKFICHCTSMLERVIKNDTWEYKKINQFYKENSYLIHVVEQNIEIVGNAFDIIIPSNEIAYVCEIFLPNLLGE